MGFVMAGWKFSAKAALKSPATLWSASTASRCASLVGVALIALAGRAAAQGTVSGQVTILEKAGEATSDFGSTVVWVEPASGSRSRPAPAMKAQIAMDGRKFVPRLRVITSGSTVDFPNQDPFNHNIFSNADGGQFDLGLYGRGEGKSAVFAKAGAYPIYCNIHSRMTGYIIVVPTMLFAQGEGDGKWAIEKVPPGRYVLHVWHERAAEVTRDLSVSGAGASGIAVQLDAKGFKVLAHKNKFGQDYKDGGVRY